MEVSTLKYEKYKKKLNKYLKIFLICWVLVVIYEVYFMNTKFGLSNFINEDSTLYLIMIITPMIVIAAFGGAFVIASHYKEITDTWKNNPEKIIDELKLLGLGVLFFFFIWGMYIVFSKQL